MTPIVEEAIAQIAAGFTGCEIQTIDDGEGGAFVTIKDVPIEGLYMQSKSWVGFRITHTYPYADIYPHFVRHDLARKDGKPLGEATSLGMFRGRSAVQLSRRANRHDAAMDTALLKLEKVLKWLKSRP
jgi:hypothetical protein